MRRLLPLLVSSVALGSLLAGCNGSSNNAIFGSLTGGNSAKVVFVNGSPDAGPVQVVIDNTEQFCTNGESGAACAVSYGQITPTGAVSVGAGNHTLTLKDQNGNVINTGVSSFAVNGGGTYSIVLAGELHPSYTASSTLTVTTFSQQPFTASPQVDFFQASPYVNAQYATGVQFGYTLGTTGTPNPLGQVTAYGSSTTPQSIPSSAQNTAISFYAVSPTSGFSAGPSIADAVNCGGNQLPCSNTTNHLNMYLVDGPAASTAPTGGTPAGMSSATTAGFIGAFAP